MIPSVISGSVWVAIEKGHVAVVPAAIGLGYVSNVETRQAEVVPVVVRFRRLHFGHATLIVVIGMWRVIVVPHVDRVIFALLLPFDDVGRGLSAGEHDVAVEDDAIARIGRDVTRVGRLMGKAVAWKYGRNQIPFL